MSSKQQEVLDFIANNSPKKIGVKRMYYKINGDTVVVKFVVGKKRAPTVASYLNSLSTVVGESNGVKIDSSVYVSDKSLSIGKTTKNMELDEFNLANNFSFNVG